MFYCQMPGPNPDALLNKLPHGDFFWAKVVIVFRKKRKLNRYKDFKRNHLILTDANQVSFQIDSECKGICRTQ